MTISITLLLISAVSIFFSGVCAGIAINQFEQMMIEENPDELE